MRPHPENATAQMNSVSSVPGDFQCPVREAAAGGAGYNGKLQLGGYQEPGGQTFMTEPSIVGIRARGF